MQTIYKYVADIHVPDCEGQLDRLVSDQVQVTHVKPLTTIGINNLKQAIIDRIFNNSKNVTIVELTPMLQLEFSVEEFLL